MTKEFKRTFFSSSIALLLVITNLLCLKYTNFASFVLPVSFITYPLISLSVIMLVDLYGRKTAKHAIFSAFILQLFILIPFLLSTSLSNQSTIPDLSIEISRIFEINVVNIITSLCSFSILSYITINLFESFKVKEQRSIGSIVCIFIFTLLYGAIYLLVTNYKLDFDMIIKLLYTHVISSVFMTMICYGLYYVLKENEEFYEIDRVTTEDKSLNDLIDEEKLKVPKKKKRRKKPNNQQKSSKDTPKK
ncbi:MAG: VUT family protein [Bacilli bacterium]|nr:VUT family protein [Bacilli bacterium]